MSKSLKRVIAALEAQNYDTQIVETGQSRTAAQAASELGCTVDQIVKSIIFAGAQSGEAVLFLTAGGNQVDGDRAAELAEEPLMRADPGHVRSQTGFAIGGVSPVGHISPIRAWADPRLQDFDIIWGAAGTPRHVFSLNPHDLPSLTGASWADFTVKTDA